MEDTVCIKASKVPFKKRNGKENRRLWKDGGREGKEVAEI